MSITDKSDATGQSEQRNVSPTKYVELYVGYTSAIELVKILAFIGYPVFMDCTYDDGVAGSYRLVVEVPSDHVYDEYSWEDDESDDETTDNQ